MRCQRDPAQAGRSVACGLFLEIFREGRQNGEMRGAGRMTLVLDENALEARRRPPKRSMHIGSQRRQHCEKRQDRPYQMEIEPERSQSLRPSHILYVD